MDKTLNRYDLDFRDLHDIIRPEDVRNSEKIIARVRRRGSNSPFEPLKVWKLTPLGVELDVSNDEPTYGKGDPVDLEITIDGERSTYEGLVVDVVQQSEHMRLLGIRLSAQSEESRDTADRRKASRWMCSDEFLPTAICPSPGHANDFTRFQIRDLSKSGMQLVCSLRNKYLLPDQTLKLTTNFPLVGDFSVAVRIARIGLTSSQGKDKLSVGVEFLKLGDDARRTIAQYLIQFSNVESLEDLRKSGLVPSSVSQAVDFYYLKTEADYLKVLELRLAAQQFDKNVKSDLTATPASLGDIEDSRSRIIVGMYCGQMVATGRIRYNEPGSALEHEKYVAWPDDQPRRDLVLEISRVCTHPDFRRDELLAGLFQFICSTSNQAEKPYILLGTWPEMMPFYEKIGFLDTGLSHSEPMWKSQQNLMIGNSIDAMLGRDVGPLYWNSIWRVAADHMIDTGMVQPDGLDVARLRLYRLFAPLAGWLLNRRRKSQEKG